MSQGQLTYCCSNPEFHNKFTIGQAERSEEILQFSTTGTASDHPRFVPLLHIVCPKCKTIAASIHLPADPL